MLWDHMIIFCEGYMCTGHIELIAFSHHRKIFQHFLHHENEFHDIYIYIKERIIYKDDDGTVGVVCQPYQMVGWSCG